MTVPPHPGVPPGPSLDPRTDEQLLTAHLVGDPSAFPELVHRHRTPLWNLALRILSSREDAADALQDAFLRALRGAAGFQGNAAVSSWLHRIMLNVCFTRLEVRKRRATVSLDDRVDDDHGRDPVDDRDPFAEADGNAVVVQMLRRLPDEQRCAVVLVDVEGYSVAAAAERLGVATGTVKSRCARGRARLAAALLDTASQQHGGAA